MVELSHDRLFELSDPTDTLDPVDGKAGYFDRWAGQGNPAYEDAALYIIGELESFGLEVIALRYEYTDIMNVQNPEAYNICAYKWGSVVRNGGFSEPISMLLLQLTLYFSTLILWDSEPTGQGQGHMTTQQELPWLWNR